MKSYQAFAALGCALLAINAAEAKTITVDNKAGSVAMYTSVQTACNDADPGDTILVAGSPTPYGSVTVTKTLHFVGPGYFLNENGIPGITKDSANLNPVFGLIELSSSNNSSVTGISCQPTVNAGVNDILFVKCYFNHINSSNFNGGVVHVKRSYFSNGCELRISGSWVRNSVIAGTLKLADGTTGSNCILTNSPGFVSVAGSSISSSIFITNSGLTATAFEANVKGSVTHSLSVGGVGIGGTPTFLPAGNGNISTTAFTVEAFVQGQALDKAYVLAAGSPAIGAGLNGVDMGIFGGTLPYVISGVPSIPRITRFQVPSTATSASGLHIEMDAQSF